MGKVTNRGSKKFERFRGKDKDEFSPSDEKKDPRRRGLDERKDPRRRAKF